MSVSNEFIEYVLDQLSGLAATCRKMFGGAGLYSNGKIFGLIADETVFLKVDDSNRAQYLEADCKQFKPFPDKPMVMPYYEIPASVLEDSSELCKWAEKSLSIPSKEKNRRKK